MWILIMMDGDDSELFAEHRHMIKIFIPVDKNSAGHDPARNRNHFISVSAGT